MGVRRAGAPLVAVALLGALAPEIRSRAPIHRSATVRPCEHGASPEGDRKARMAAALILSLAEAEAEAVSTPGVREHVSWGRVAIGYGYGYGSGYGDGDGYGDGYGDG